MALSRTATFQNDFGVFYKVYIYDSLLPADSTNTFQLGGTGFQLTYHAKDRTRFSGVIASSVSFDIIPRDSSEETLIENIASAAYGRFQVVIKKSSDDVTYDPYWAGNLLSDVAARENLSFQAGKQSTITATDGLAELVDVDWNDGNTYVTGTTYRLLAILLKILRDNTLLNTSQYWGSTDSFIFTVCNWYTSQMPTPAADKDPLHFSGVKPEAFNEEKDGQFVPINAFEVLDRIARAWGARLFLSNGVWQFVQVNSYGQTNPYGRNYRKTNTTLISSGTVSNVTTGGNILGGGTFDSLHPVQTVEIYYDFLSDYQLIQDSIVVWNRWTSSGGVTGPFSTTVKDSSSNLFSLSLGNIPNEADNNLSWNLNFLPNLFATGGQYNSSNPYSSSFMSGIDTRLLVRLKLVGDGGTTYYLNLSEGSQGVGKEWTTSSAFVGLNSIYFGNFGAYNNGGVLNNYSSLLQITGHSIDNQAGTIDAIPDSGALSIEGYGVFYFLQGATNSTASTIVDNSMAIYPTGTSGISLGLAKPDGTNTFMKYLVNNESTTQVLFEATQGTTVSSSIVTLDSTLLGTGPTASSATRIITFDAAGNGDNGTTADWQVYVQTTGDGVTGTISNILCKEVLSGRKSGVLVYNGALRKNAQEYIHAYSDISGSKIFVPNELTYTANDGIWDGQWIETETDITGQTYIDQDIVDAGAQITTAFTNNY